jgi:hypothetical protein
MNGRCAWALLALLIASNSSLTADPLAQPEKDYVVLMTLSVAVTNMCDGYDGDDTNVLKFAYTRAVDIWQWVLPLCPPRRALRRRRPTPRGRCAWSCRSRSVVRPTSLHASSPRS